MFVISIILAIKLKILVSILLAVSKCLLDPITSSQMMMRRQTQSNRGFRNLRAPILVVTKSKVEILRKKHKIFNVTQLSM